jgi:[acyl-carrier-protein] S-malonyltransferase
VDRLAAAGALGFADAVRLVHLRGQFMQDAVPVGVGAMAALMGLDLVAGRALCAEASARWRAVRAGQPQRWWPDRDLGSRRRHRSRGRRGQGQGRQARRQAVGQRALPLLAHGAGRRRLAGALAEIAIAAPRVPVYANVTAAPTQDPATIRRLLVEQVTGAVRWEESVAALAAAGVTRGLELGAGSVLRGLVKRIADGIDVTTIGEPHEVLAYCGKAA